MQKILIAVILGVASTASFGQTLNSPFATLAINVSPPTVLGIGPTFANVITDSPIAINIQGFGSGPFILLFGNYAVGTYTQFGLGIDVAGFGPAGVGQIAINGWDNANPGSWTGPNGQISINAIIPACTVGVGGAATCVAGAIAPFALQSITLDPTAAPFNIRASGAAQCSVLNGYTNFPLVNLSNDNALAYNFPFGFNFNYYGVNYGSCSVGENGYIAFGAANGAGFINPTVAAIRTGPPRIMSCFTDLVTVPAIAAARVYAQYSVIGGLPQIRFGHDRLNEFGGTPGQHGGEITIYANGDVRVTVPGWNNINTIPLGVGLTPGNNIDSGVPPAPGQTAFGRDLSADWATAQTTGPVPAGVNRAAFELFTIGGTIGGNAIDLIGLNWFPLAPNASGILFQRDPTIPQTQYLIQ